jgi:site-specific DNA recombinase
MKKAIILARVSTEDQYSEGHSIPAQLAKAREYAQRKEFEVISEHQFDESSLKDQRTKFDKVIDDIKASREPIALIVETVDRLQRSFKESVLLDDFRKSGRLEIHFIRESLIVHKDSNSSEIQRWDLAVFLAKSYVLQISDNVKRSIKHKLQNGECSGKPPFGYLNIRSEDNKAWIVPHPFRSKIVQFIYEKYSTGAYSMKTIGKMVKDEFCIDFHTGKIDYVLKQPFYYGEMLHKGIRYPHRYETIISKELFDLVQNIKSDANKKPFKYAGLPYLYRGLVRCEKCECAFTPEKKKGKYIYYHCTEYHGACNKKWIREEELTKQFAKYFDKIHISEEIVESISKMLRESHQGKADYNKEICQSLQEEYDKLERRIERMYEDFLDRNIDEDFFKQKREDYRREQKNIRKRLDNLEGADDGYYVSACYLLQLANKAPAIFESSEVETKRQLIKLVLQNPVIHGVTLSATIRKPFSYFAKGPSHHIELLG